MRYNLTGKKLFSSIWGLFLFTAIVSGQVYHFINYGTDKKIPSGFIYTLNQDENGFLWVGTGAGLARFDGFDFLNVPFPDSIENRYPTASLKDKNGILWFGCNDGSVFYSDLGNLKAVPLSNDKPINSILERDDGSVLIVPQGGSVFVTGSSDPENIKRYYIDPGQDLFSACFTGSGDILLGSQENIIICRFGRDSLTTISTISGFDYSSIKAIHKMKSRETYLVGTDGNGLFTLDLSGTTNRLTRIGNYPELDFLSVQSVMEDYEGNLWISTYDSGIIRISYSPDNKEIESVNFVSKESGLPGSNIKLVFQDLDGNYWIGLAGDGLSLLNSYAFSFYSPADSQEANNVVYINKISNNYFIGTSAGFYLFDLKTNKSGPFFNLLARTGAAEILSYSVDRFNNIWIGTRSSGLFVRKPSGEISRFFRSWDSGLDYIRDIETDDKNIWLATLNGVLQLDRNSGEVKDTFNINNGLPHNSINQLYLTSKGTVAVATKTDRLYLIDPESGIIPGKVHLLGPVMNEITSFYESYDGHIWAATNGTGVFEFNSDTVKTFTRVDMLMSDYCYSIIADSINRIWIGHERGFSRYNRNNGVMRTFGTDFASGGVCNPGAMFESTDGMILIGTTRGFIVYDRLKDKKIQAAPFNNITSVTINDVKFPYRPEYSLPYNKRYSVKVGYTGINFSEPEKVYYQTMLENYDENWRPVTTDREIGYILTDGRYRFNLISVNDGGLSQDVPVTFDIIIKKPWFRTWWFIFSTILISAGAFVLIVREREKSQKKVQVYLEKELDARTAVVMKQKYELEIQNIEITDSINYAKRIQTSILPDFNKVKELFNDAFILFKPRDIVSGDFYWFDKYDDDKFILVCADSTGHGVPGAFMSMIGSTLLQDIVSRQKFTRPSEILKMLDKQIFSTLNQNIELGVSNDGMDMVVCKIDTKTRHIVFASAMRPIILVMGGESYYIKGNRSSVGGESVIEKYFDDQEYYLNDGDMLYLFSDGLPDQFGGAEGKKMKIARLRKLIEEVSNLTMHEQKQTITRYYEDWSNGYEQVDDILLIGIKL